MTRGKTYGYMLGKMLKLRDPLHLLHHCAPADFIVSVAYIKADANEVWPVLEHHPDSVDEHCSSSRHERHLARLEIFS